MMCTMSYETSHTISVCYCLLLMQSDICETMCWPILYSLSS